MRVENVYDAGHIDRNQNLIVCIAEKLDLIYSVSLPAHLEGVESLRLAHFIVISDLVIFDLLLARHEDVPSEN